MSGRGSRQRRDKARGQLQAIRRELRAANLVLEVRDARAPRLTSVENLLGDQSRKPRGVVLTKADLAEPGQTKQWLAYLASKGRPAVAVDCKDARRAGRELKRFVGSLAEKRRGAAQLTRLAIVGLPNVGKSTIINRLVGRNRAAVGNRPGITRGKQWIKVDEGVVVLDTPGVIQLFAGMERKLGNAFFKLALCNVVPAGQYEDYDCVDGLLDYLRARFDSWPFDAYRGKQFATIWRLDTETVLERFALANGFKARGGLADCQAAAERIVADFQRGLLAPLSLELPPDAGGVR